jgi:molecular chaperone HscB
MNYFELYELPIQLKVDAVILKQKFYILSRKYHPDLPKSEYEQTRVVEISSIVNKAFKTFSNLNETIKYVLQLKELLIEEEKYELSPIFLMEMMELSEQAMEAKWMVKKILLTTY